MNQKLRYKKNCFTGEEILERIENETIYVEGDDLKDFANDLLETFYERERELSGESYAS